MLGGGPAGLACALGLRAHNFRGPITLVDRDDAHVIQPRLHEALRPGVAPVRVPFETIAAALGLAFRHAAVSVDEATLAAADRSRCLRIGDEIVPFDFLVVALGSQPRPGAPRACPDLRTLRRAPSALDRSLDRWIVGGGPSAVQFAAELAPRAGIRLVSADPTLLAALPPAFDRHARRHLERRGVVIELGRRLDDAPPGSLWLTGVAPTVRLRANRFGQVRGGRAALDRVFGAGDAVCFEGPGMNDTSAQAAVAKGKHVAGNIRRAAAGRWLRPYAHRSRGYVLSLGPRNGIAWTGREDRIVTGRAAVLLHEAISAQYAAMLRGLDLFVQAG